MLKTFILFSTAAFTGNMSLITVHRMSVIHVAGVALLSDSMPWLSADLSSVSALFPRHSTHITVSGIVASSFRFLDLHTPSLSFSLHFSLFKFPSIFTSIYFICASYVCMGVCGFYCVIFPILLYISIFQIVTKETFAFSKSYCKCACQN